MILFRTFRPRHPLARIAVAVLGTVVVAGFIALSLFAIVALAIGGALFLLLKALRGTPRPATAEAAPSRGPAPGVIEGEYVVVQGPPARETAR